MITIRSKTNIDGDSKIHFEFDGTSQDDIPKTWDGQPVEQNSIFHELDTGNDYYYDGQNWQKVGTGGGSGDMEWRTFTVAGLPNGYTVVMPAYITFPNAPFNAPFMSPTIGVGSGITLRAPVVEGECLLLYDGVMYAGAYDKTYSIDATTCENIDTEYVTDGIVRITADNAVVSFKSGSSPT